MWSVMWVWPTMGVGVAKYEEWVWPGMRDRCGQVGGIGVARYEGWVWPGMRDGCGQV